MTTYVCDGPEDASGDRPDSRPSAATSIIKPGEIEDGRSRTAWRKRRLADFDAIASLVAKELKTFLPRFVVIAGQDRRGARLAVFGANP